MSTYRVQTYAIEKKTFSQIRFHVYTGGRSPSTVKSISLGSIGKYTKGWKEFILLYCMGVTSYIFVSFSADIISTGDDTLKFYALNNIIVASDLCHTQRNVKRNGFTITLIIYC